MSLSAPFIRRPTGTTLLTVALALAGILAYFLLPVAPLPQVEFPTIFVNAGLPGASPDTMASAVTTPLERQLGQIAGLTEMTSQSSLGSTSIALQFDLSRDVNAAARDVQAAINASASQLPANLPSLPTWRKFNPADFPILIIDMTSDLYSRGQMYDSASTVLAQKFSQVDGVGSVYVWGGALPAVRVELNPMQLNNMGLSLDDVRNVLAAANANRPKGQLTGPSHQWDVGATDQLLKARDYAPLVVAYHNGAAVRLSDLGTVSDSVENIHSTGIANGKPAILIAIFKQADANILDTAQRVKDAIPQLQAAIPAAMHMHIMMDRTQTIEASVRDVEFALLVSVCLVILVVFFFLREPRATLIPSVAVPISLLGTFGVMYLCGYSIDNLSLMALAVATGFVVDDAIVVIENISRHIEAGMRPHEAALLGAREIGFTVLSMSTSLVAVFIPILFMSGIIGRIFREFAVVLSIAVAISMVVSLTTTPMMCATILRHRPRRDHGRLYNAMARFERFFTAGYEHSLQWVLRHSFIMLLLTLATIALTVYLYIIIPKNLLPSSDNGRIGLSITADQDTSSAVMADLLAKASKVVAADPGVEGYGGFAGGTPTNSARMFITLKPLNQRKASAQQIIARLSGKLARIPGADMTLRAFEDISIGARQSAASIQYTLQSENLEDLTDWAPKVYQKLRDLKGLGQVNSDLQVHGREAYLTIDRPTASRLGFAAGNIDNLLYDAFGQRQVSTMYASLNQYHVVMEVDPKYAQDPSALRYVYANNAQGRPIPLSAFTALSSAATPLSINHQAQFPAVTISFNLLQGSSMSDAVSEIQNAIRELGLPPSIHGSFPGTAGAFQESLVSELWLALGAVAAVYIVLGMLYESLMHPVTILSTIPSAGVGALLALIVFNVGFSFIAFIGIILLIGIVKKNAIMMIDFALDAERQQGKHPRDAIFQACMLRFRPIMMTTMAALLGGLPLAIGGGIGSELRRPLGIAIVGGLALSQLLTLYTTPVIYLYLDRLRWWATGRQTDRLPSLRGV